MNSDDLLMRGEVREALFDLLEYTGWYERARDVIDLVPAVPREMTAVEYLRTMRSICEDGRNCGKCPLSYNNNGAGINCQDYAAHYPEKAVAAVQKWAEGHPERSEDVHFAM